MVVCEARRSVIDLGMQWAASAQAILNARADAATTVGYMRIPLRASQRRVVSFSGFVTA